MGDVGLAGAELEGENLAAADEGEEAAASGCTSAPVCGGEGWRDDGGYGEGGAGPGEEGFALEETPVGCAVELEDAEGGEGRFGGDEGGGGGWGGDFLVEKGDSDEGATEGGEEAECGDCAGRVARGREADEGAAAGVEVLGGREGDGEEGQWRAEDLKGRVYGRMVSFQICKLGTRLVYLEMRQRRIWCQRQLCCCRWMV